MLAPFARPPCPARVQLCNLYIWWQSLSMVEKRLPANKEFLVRVTEENMNAEISAYIKASQRQGKPKTEEDDDEEAKNPSSAFGRKEK